MRCPYCENTDDKVVDSRLAEEGAAIRRRRECLGCGKRYTTFERTEAVWLRVVKRGGESEPFDRSKIASGIRKACKNRPVPEEDIDRAAERIEEVLRARGLSEISSEDVGLAVLEQLRDLDEVAYVRFASVYRGFENVGDFEREVGRLLKETPPKGPHREPAEGEEGT